MDEICGTQGCKQTESSYYQRYELSIQELDVGYIVRVGCKSFAFSDKETMLLKVNEYLQNPSEIQKRFESTGKI